MTDFDQQLSRKNTNSVKWDGIVQTYHKEDLIPLWVADMDFYGADTGDRGLDEL